MRFWPDALLVENRLGTIGRLFDDRPAIVVHQVISVHTLVFLDRIARVSKVDVLVVD